MSSVSDPPTNAPPGVRFFSVSEAALIFGVTKQLIYAWAEAEKLRVYRFGANNQDIRIRRQDLETLIDAQGETSVEEIQEGEM